MATTKRKNTRTSTTQVEKPKTYCRVCQGTKSERNFYETTNPKIDTNGKMSICKDCCNTLVDRYFAIFNDMEKALLFTCEDLDMVYYKPSVEAVKTYVAKSEQDGVEPSSIIGKYKSSLGQNKNYLAGMRFKDSTELDINRADNVVFDSDEYDSISVEYLKAKWGNLPVEDLQYLEQKWTEWEEGYDIAGKSRAILVQQLCFEELGIYKDRVVGNDASKKIKTLREMLKDSNLSPKQESASESAEFASLPKFIEKVEKTRPAYKENEILKDVDNMDDKIQSLVGGLTRSLGKNNEYVEKFNEVYKDFTMDLSNLEDGDKNA